MVSLRHTLLTASVPAATLGAALTCAAAPGPSQDWPSHRADAQRSGTTSVELDLESLGEVWVHEATALPRPAWPGPARWDAFARIKGLASMREYDPCFHVISVGDRLWYGSSADDAVHCLDTRTGRRLWRFVSDGPIRVAPSFHDGRLYFGSDDGHAYCIDAEDGSLVWRYRPSTPETVLHDGNVVSFWPVRTGVLVDDGLAYFGASMLPWKQSYLCAVDAERGTEPPEIVVPRFDPQAETWQPLGVPGDWGATSHGALSDYDGFAWYRCAVDVPTGTGEGPWTLELGKIDDCDVCFVNGAEVGRFGVMPPAEYAPAHTEQRTYQAPAALLREGERAFIAVRVYDGGGGGGMVAPAPRLSRGDWSQSLAGFWQFRLGDDPAWIAPADFSANATEPAAVFPQAPPPLQAFQRSFSEQTMEGPLLLSDRQIVVPQGRVAPLLYRRADGRSQGALEGGGGVFVLLTDDQHVIHGPGNKTGWMTESAGDSRAKLASFDRGHALVVSGHWAFLLSDSSISAIDRTERKLVWQEPVDERLALILAGDHLFLGGEDSVAAYDAESGRRRWQAPVQGRAYGLAAAHGRLYVSTDEGRVHCFSAVEGRQNTEPRVARRDLLTNSPRVRRSARVERLLGRWVFHRSAMRDAEDDVPTGSTVSAARVLDQAGKLDASLPGPARIERFDQLEAAVFNGSFHGTVHEDFKQTLQPKEKISIEAWARVDAVQEWGALLGCCQDNGAYERGWLLGYRGKRFAMTLTGSETEDERATCLRAHADFTPGAWHHVVGTYDGETMRLYVDGMFSAESDTEKGPILFPDKASMQIGAYKDDDEYFPLRGAIHEVRLYEKVLRERDIRARYEAKKANFPPPPAPPVVEVSHELAAGPWLRFLGGGRAQVEWETAARVATKLRWGLDEESQEVEHSRKKRHHVAILEGLRPRRVYHYQIVHSVDDEEVVSQSYECDTFFDWSSRPGIQLVHERGAQAGASSRFTRPLLEVTPHQGLILVVADPGDGGDEETGLRLARSLCEATQARVVLGARDPAQQREFQEALADTGLYGHRCRVTRLAAEGPLALPEGVFDAVVCMSTLMDPDSPDQSSRFLRHLRSGGRLLTRRLARGDVPPASAELAGAAFEEVPFDADSRLLSWVREPAEDSGSWSHMYASADNSGFGGEALGGARSTEDLEVQWLGRPGPRYQSDRQNRKPSPLCVNGRLYLQGLYRILGLRAHNGTILWSLELPRMVRFNVTRDCSNWCADDEHVFVSVQGECWRLDGETGEIEARLTPPVTDRDAVEWGYVARVGPNLLGTVRPAGTAFTEWWGSAHWYDGKFGSDAAKAASDALFAIDPQSGELRWQLSRGAILESTITVADGRVYYVETRHPEVLADATRRIHRPESWLDLHLVAADVDTGEVLYDRPIQPAPGITAFYLAAGEGSLILSSSTAGSFHVYSFDAATGDAGWTQSFPWEADHHGKHLAHPAIADGQVFLRPQVLDLATGQSIKSGFPVGHTCSSYSLTTKSLFMRAGSITMWTPESDLITRWPRLRPDCWISTIPADGLLLSPEGGGGCSCGSWMETSLAFRPRNDDP